MKDFSFLRLTKNNFAKAISSDNPAISELNYSGMIQLLPNEFYTQITNLDSDIAFAGNIKVELINCNEKVIEDITNQFFYDEFTDIKGIKQIAYEFATFNDYHAELLLLKISHTVSDSVWYSNPFFCSNYQSERTTHLKYKNEYYFNGISYDKAFYFQSIRIQTFKNDVDVSIESKEYTQLSGSKISLRNITTYLHKYKMEMCDFFMFDRLVSLFNHDIIYIDNFRVSNKPTAKKGDRIGLSNFFNLDFEFNPSDEFLGFQYQIYEPLNVLSRVVENGTYSSIPNNGNSLSLTFNKEIEITNDIEAKIYKDGVLYLTVNPIDFSVSGNILTLDTSANPIVDKAEYAIVIQPNKVFEGFDHWQGFEFGNWLFNIIDGDYDANDYDSNDYLIY